METLQKRLKGSSFLCGSDAIKEEANHLINRLDEFQALILAMEQYFAKAMFMQVRPVFCDI